MLDLDVLLIDRNALSHISACALVVLGPLLLLARVVVVLRLLLPLVKPRTLLWLTYGSRRFRQILSVALFGNAGLHRVSPPEKNVHSSTSYHEEAQ
jgi:hypothetical protein